MADSPNNDNKISRRGLLPLLGMALLVPLLGFGNSSKMDIKIDNENDEYQTLLKPDGTTVKVKTSALNKSKVIKKKLSNNALLNWLEKKL